MLLLCPLVQRRGGGGFKKPLYCADFPSQAQRSYGLLPRGTLSSVRCALAWTCRPASLRWPGCRPPNVLKKTVLFVAGRPHVHAGKDKTMLSTVGEICSSCMNFLFFLSSTFPFFFFCLIVTLLCNCSFTFFLALLIPTLWTRTLTTSRRHRRQHRQRRQCWLRL